MSRRMQQSGQALVAALVTTALLFALAGGLAVAVSAALNAQGPSTSTYLRDVEASSTTAAVLSRVAGSGGARGGCPSGSVFGDIPTPRYGCHEVDLVNPGQVTDVALQWSGSCGVGRVAGAGRAAAWINTVRALPSASSFYIDGNASGCSPGPGACTAAESSSGPGRFYLVADCRLAAFPAAYAHVAAPAATASVFRFAVLVSYLPTAAIPLSPGIAPIAAASLRGAGAPVDLVVGNRQTGTVAVLLGRGDGTFAAPVLYRLPGDVSALTVADLGTGHLSIAATSFFRNSVTILTGAGDGSFAVGPETPLEPNEMLGPVAITAGGLLPGGGQALAVANYLDRSVTLLGVNGGAVTPIRTDGVGDPPTAVASLDFGNGGTYLGVAKGDGGTGELVVESVQAPGKLHDVASYPLAGVPGAIARGTFDGTGYPDLAITIPGQDEVQVLLGSGSGRFNVVASPVVLAGPPSALVAVNIDGRPRAGLAVANGFAASLSVWIGNGDGTFRPLGGGDLATDRGPAGVAAGDVDGGGTDGLAVANAGAGTVNVLLPNRSKVFSVLAAAPDGSAYNEADLVWADRSGTDRLIYEGGLR